MKVLVIQCRCGTAATSRLPSGSARIQIALIATQAASVAQSTLKLTATPCSSIRPKRHIDVMRVEVQCVWSDVLISAYSVRCMRRPQSLPDAVMAEIQRAFIHGGWKIGEQLPPERELAKQLSVGRSSLREAMQGLQTMGLVEVRHGVGTFLASEPGKWLLSPLRFHGTPP